MQQASDIPKITTINFEGIGKLTKYNKEVGMLTKPHYIIPSNFRIPFSDPKIVAQRINQKFDTIEGIRYKYDDVKHCWEVEFGTKPIELTVDPKDYKMQRIINAKKWWALHAANKAAEKYGDALNLYGDDNELPPPQIDLKWCRFVINFYYDEETKEIIVEFNRPWGDADSFTYYQFFNFVKKAFIN
jgi:hypothetical protein